MLHASSFVVSSGAGTLLADSIDKDLLVDDKGEISLGNVRELVAETIVNVVGPMVGIVVVVVVVVFLSQPLGPARPQIVM
jgi:hypothetical protein